MRKPVGWEDPHTHSRNCNSVFGGTHGPADDTSRDFLEANHKVYRLYKCFTITNSPNAPLLPSSTLNIFCQLPQYSTTLGWLPVFVENDMALPQRHCSPRTCLRLWASHQMYASLWAVLRKAGHHFFKKEHVDTRVLGTPLLLIVTANSYCILMLHAVLT